MDGSLERLVKLLQDFCYSPSVPENPSAIYGLLPPSSLLQIEATDTDLIWSRTMLIHLYNNIHPVFTPKLRRGLPYPISLVLQNKYSHNTTQLDEHATYRFPLAFQCVVNIGVRGSEQI